MKYYVEAYGCTMNKGETKMLAERLSTEGHTRVTEADSADTAIIGTCVVIEKTEERMKRRIHELEKICDKVIVTGCLATTGEGYLKSNCPGVELIGAGEIDISSAPEPSLIGSVPMATGCTGGCAYCITKLARGELKSRSLVSIKNRFKSLLRQGAVEIRLTCQDTASYGADIGTDLPHLMDELDRYEGEHRIRIGMMNPDTALPIKEELVEILIDSHFYRFLHVPLQSGSDEVLDKMDRRYTAEQWISLIQYFRKHIPDLTLSTDVIVGFPGETEDDFQKTLSLIKAVKPDILNITRFSPRPNTPAYDMDDKIHSREKKRRSKMLTELYQKISLKQNEEHIGVESKALINEDGKNNTVMGRMENYKVVVVEGGKELLGRWVDVKITEATGVYLKGRLI